MCLPLQLKQMKERETDSNKAVISSDSPIIQRTPQEDLIRRTREDARAHRETTEYLNQAVEALNAKAYPQAVEAFQRVLRHNPESAEGHFYLGLTYFMVGDYKKAAASYKMAIACEPTDATAHLNLGIVYELLKRYDEAIAAYQRSIALEPNNPEAHSQLGAAYAMVGNRAKAVAAYKEAIRVKLLSE